LRIRAASGSNLANARHSRAIAKATAAWESRRRENAGGKERSLGFKAAINPLRPFLKPSARASGGQPWLLPDCIPRYFAPPFRLPRPRIHPRPFRPIATISADVGGILTNSIASAVSEPREAADFSAYRVCVRKRYFGVGTKFQSFGDCVAL